MANKVIGDITIRETAKSFMNLNNKKSFLYDILETFLDFCITYPLAALTTYAITGGTDSGLIYRMYLLLPGLFYLTIIRNFVLKNKLYMILNIPLFCALVLVSELRFEMAAIYVFIITASIYSGIKRSREVVEFRYMQNMLFGEGLLLFEYGISSYFKYTPVKNAIVFNCIMFSLAYLIYFHITRTKKLMEWEGQTSKEAVRKINSASSKFIGGLSVGFGAVALAVWKGNLFGLGEKFIHWVLSLIPKINIKIGDTKLSDQRIKEMNDSLDKLGYSASKKPSIIASVIMKIIEVVIVIGVSAIAIFLVYTIIKLLYEIIMEYLSGGKSKNNDERESLFNIKDILDEVVGKAKRAGKNISSSFDPSNNGKIRKMYFKVVMKSKNQSTIIKRSYTPHKIDDVILKEANKDITIATGIYERARYGSGDCRKEDVESIKNLKP